MLLLGTRIPCPGQPNSFPFCLSQGFYSCTKPRSKLGVEGGEERVYSAYTSTLLFIAKGTQDWNSHRAGTWRQELMQRPGRVLLTGLLPLACSACFLIEPRTTSPGMAPSTRALPSLITNRENTLQLDLMEAFLQGRLLSL